MKLLAFLTVGISGGLAACSLGPRYQRPDTAVAPAEYREALGWTLATPSDIEPRGPWWTVFQDPALDALETQVTDANQDLKAAFARLQEARAQTRMAGAAQFPNVTADASATRAQASLNSPSYPPGAPPKYIDFVAGAALSYEIDLFGRVRNTIAAARATKQETAGDVAALDLDLRADLASNYFELRGLDAQQELIDHTVADYQKALRLTEFLPCGGLAAKSDVQQAQAELDLARTSQLLERRPDVAAAERRVAAANAGIGVARAAYFPVFSLAAAAGSDSVSASSWLGAPSRFWSLGPQGLPTVFDGGLHRAQSVAARAAYDEQVANYRSNVLTAFQEVEDNLAALRQLKRESVSEAAAVASTQGPSIRRTLAIRAVLLLIWKSCRRRTRR
jgi:outer membrane protein, multidrug efflux system